MTEKTYTGKEFAPVFYNAMVAWYDGGCVGANPTTLWECKDITPLAGMIEDNTWDSRPTMPTFVSAYQYRWKPKPKRMVTIGYPNKSKLWIEKTLVAPEAVAPKIYFKLGCDSKMEWVENTQHRKLLQDGEVFLTREDAQAMFEWLAACRKGGAV
jgi:hypothetical protein